MLVYSSWKTCEIITHKSASYNTFDPDNVILTLHGLIGKFLQKIVPVRGKKLKFIKHETATRYFVMLP